MMEGETETQHRAISAGRILAISRTTFTQLTRMRVFYFLLIFSLMILGVSLMIENFNTDKARELKVLKDMAFFSMSMFSTIFAVAATAMLLPKDIEDRTLYTILAKPVPRIEYLLGKYLGSLFIILISLIVMTFLLYGILYLRQTAIYNAEAPLLRPDDLIFLKRQLAQEGVSWNLLNASIAILLQSSVLAATTLLISTFASSTLFTIIVTLMVFFVGYAQPLVIDYWRHAHEIDRVGASLIYLFELAFPNFQNFNVIDGIVAGEQLPFGSLMGMIGIAVSYVSVYLFAAYLFFARKEL